MHSFGTISLNIYGIALVERRGRFHSTSIPTFKKIYCKNIFAHCRVKQNKLRSSIVNKNDNNYSYKELN